MSLFEELYYNLTFEEEVNHRGDVLIRTQEACQCVECGCFTRWLSLSFMGHHCSEECNQDAWDKYLEAYNRETSHLKSFGSSKIFH